MKKITVSLLAMAFAAMLIIPTIAKPPMILPVRDTWDADMVNSDITGYTGAGVYIAVLDTGLVPFWRDYFPVERIAST